MLASLSQSSILNLLTDISKAYQDMINQYLLLDIKYQDLKKHFQNLQKEQASATTKVKKKRQPSGGKND